MEAEREDAKFGTDFGPNGLDDVHHYTQSKSHSTKTTPLQNDPQQPSLALYDAFHRAL
jgi:hypothetical protein